MPIGRLLALACVVSAACSVICLADEGFGSAAGFRVPDGFEVAQFADDALAHNIYSLTFDAEGRVVVAGPGYIKRLHDDDGDDQADRAELISVVPLSGAQGLCFDGDDLICTGDGALRRLVDRNSDGRTDGAGNAWAKLANPEHGAHAVVRGPDGWFYVICGNDAGVDDEHVSVSTSPVADPHSGTVLRVSPDGAKIEVFAHGFRNPYDLGFDAEGRLWTVDADGERAHHLPWYTPTRLFDIAQGMHHGWLERGWQKNWARPASYFDNVERAAELGRGSPTGLVIYRHRQFPARYRHGVFSACWTLGRVYFLPLAPSGATCTSTPELFVESSDDSGFAPVDMAVSPEGDLYVAIGGRATRGGVYRIRYGDDHLPAGDLTDPLDRVLNADQPLAAWSRAEWLPLAKRLGREAFEAATIDSDRNSAARCRAMEVLVDVFDGPTLAAARRAVLFNDAQLSARTAWAIARHRGHDEGVAALLAELTHHSDPRVARAAWEGLARRDSIPVELATQPNWLGAMAGPHRRVRAAMLHVARSVGNRSFRRMAGAFDPQATDRTLLGYLWVIGPRTPEDAVWTETFLRSCLHVFENSEEAEVRLEALRLIQIGLGDMRPDRDGNGEPTGYVAASAKEIDMALRQQLASRLSVAFPTHAAELDRELARTVCMLEVSCPKLIERLAPGWTAKSDPIDDVHYLIVASRLAGPRSEKATQATAEAFVRLDAKLAERNMYPSRTWPERVVQAFDRSCELDPKLATALIEAPGFGVPAHARYVARMPGSLREQAARRLLNHLASADLEDVEWTGELTGVLAELPYDETAPVLRDAFESFAARDAVLPLLARYPSEKDRGRYVQALLSADDEVVLQTTEALQSLESEASSNEIQVALSALWRYRRPSGSALAKALRGGKDDLLAAQRRAVAGAIHGLLAHWSQADERAGGMDSTVRRSFDDWLVWFATRDSVAAKQLAGRLRGNVSWQAKLENVDWSAGDAERGLAVFERQNCHRCHRGTSRLGPDLKGVATRLARTDLFAAIAEPDRDVSPTYQTSLVTTRSGNAFHGLVVYESPEATLVQVDADKTVRIVADEQPTIQPSRRSLMPTGLLDPLAEQDLADLYAYLKTLDAGE